MSCRHHINAPAADRSRGLHPRERIWQRRVLRVPRPANDNPRPPRVTMLILAGVAISGLAALAGLISLLDV